MKNIYILLTLLIFPQILFSDLFFMKGNSTIINAKANLVYTIPVKDAGEKIKVLIYQFKNFTNGVNKQIISAYKPKITPKPTSYRKFSDNMGNSRFEITFTKPKSDIRIESNFIINNEVDIAPIEEYFNFPLDPSATNYVSHFMKGTTLTPITYRKLKQIVRKITKSSKTEFQAVMTILGWIQKNVKYTPEVSFDGAKQVFVTRKGNRNGILNLSLTMLRMAKIPCRYVHGLSIDKSFILNGKNSNTNIKYPKSFYNWIEVYFPNRDWVAIDPLSAYFFLPSNLLRRNVGLDSNHNLERFSSMGKKIRSDFQFFIELPREMNNISLSRSFSKSPYYLFFPELDYEGGHLVQTLFQKKNRVIDHRQVVKGDEVHLSFQPFPLNFDNTKENIDLRISPGYFYAQKVQISDEFQLKEVKIPLFRFNNSPTGKIWIEIYDTDKKGEKPRKLLAKSDPVEISDISKPGQYEWGKFSFESSSPKVLLKKGTIWILLKYKTQEVILWRGLFGNPFQNFGDTFYISKKDNKLNRLYLDLYFQIIGTPLQK